MPNYISCDGVSFSYPNRRVLTDVSFTVSPGHIAGLVGENGAGKSTLLAIIAGKTQFSGVVKKPESTSLLAQEIQYTSETLVSELIDEAIAPVRAIAEQIEALGEQFATNPSDELADAYDEALTRAEHAQVWSIDARVEEILAGLGLSDIDKSRAVSELSGGQRRRFALATLLLQPSDALLLDEPTNHLDDAAVDFLISQLQRFHGPVVAASHDRWFLDHCATQIIDIDPSLGPEGGFGEDRRQGVTYTGSFSDYLESRTRLRNKWVHDYAAQEEIRKELEGKLGLNESDIFHREVSKSESRISAKFYSDRAAKTVGNRIASARHQLEELSRREIPAPPPQLSFAGIPSRPVFASPEPLVQLLKVSVHNRLRPTSLKVDAGNSVLVIGPNGSGKSTLLEVIAGNLCPDEGVRRIVEGARVGYLPQDIEWEDPSVSPRVLTPGIAERGLLPESHLDTPLSQLSLGQQRRVAIDLVLADPPDVLLLDEPTNHLSLAIATELEQALADFPGVCVIASHDRWLRHNWQGAVLKNRPWGRDSNPLDDAGSGQLKT